jgi:hypothetical protein
METLGGTPSNGRVFAVMWGEVTFARADDHFTYYGLSGFGHAPNLSSLANVNAASSASVI